MRPAQAVIDLKALRHNFQLAKTLSHAKTIAVVKADAYGHGAVQCAHALSEHTEAFAVACIEEALALRDAGIKNPILLLEGFFEEQELLLINQYDLWTVVHSDWQIKVIEKISLAKPLTVFLKMDSGMHRVGFLAKEYPFAYQRLVASKKTSTIRLMSHFSRADESKVDYTQKQFDTFQEIAKALQVETCICNSPAILSWPEIHSTWVRPGIMLYGSTPFEQTQYQANHLIPVMTLQSKIIAVREIPANEPIGYGARFITKKPMRIGVVAMGYADGYPRQVPNNAPVLVNNTKTCLIGRVSMDMLTIDITDIPSARLGSNVELWGKNILASDIALLANTISYQLFCNVKRVPKIFIE